MKSFISSCLTVKYTLIFFIIANVFSFSSFWISFPVGLLFSILSAIFLIIFLNPLIRILLKKESTFFVIYLLFEIISFTNYAFVEYSRNIISANPTLILQAISYILIPQLLFYYLGFTDILNKSLNMDFNLRVISNIFFIVFLFGIYLHFFRPIYFINFQERVFLNNQITGYINFYPKFTIYWNSMIVGVLGVALFWTTILVDNRNFLTKFITGLIFFVAIIFSTQRGAWASLLITLLIFLILFFSLRTLKYIIIMLILLVFAMLILKNEVNIDSPIFLDLFSRLDAFDNAFNERSDQYENFKYLISKFPFGVGLGLLSHKASDLNLLYTTPDGNYYRIFGELGILGFFSFFMLIVSSVYKSFKKKLKLFIIIIIVYLLQSFGTNVLDLYVASFYFWYIIGQVNGFEKSVLLTKRN